MVIIMIISINYSVQSRLCFCVIDVPVEYSILIQNENIVESY